MVFVEIDNLMCHRKKSRCNKDALAERETEYIYIRVNILYSLSNFVPSELESAMRWYSVTST